MAHVRRYFKKALDYDNANGGWELGEIRELYAIDWEAREKGIDQVERKTLLEEKAFPVFNDFAIWLRDKY
jgi:hypothetical protein